MFTSEPVARFTAVLEGLVLGRSRLDTCESICTNRTLVFTPLNFFLQVRTPTFPVWIQRQLVRRRQRSGVARAERGRSGRRFGRDDCAQRSGVEVSAVNKSRTSTHRHARVLR
jgi:hypothetical protein